MERIDNNNDIQGILTSETRCLNCETVTSKDEEFCDLSIDVDQNTSLTSCLRNFSSTETLCSENKFKCDSCSSYQVECQCLTVSGERSVFNYLGGSQEDASQEIANNLGPSLEEIQICGAI